MRVHFDAAGRVAGLFACCALIGGFFGSVNAQSHVVPAVRQSGPERGSSLFLSPGAGSTAQIRELGDTVAIVPWNYKNGRDSGVQSAHEVCSQLLLATGLNVFLIKSSTGAMPPPMSGVSGSKKADSPFGHLLKEGRRMVTQDAPNKPNAVYVLPTLEEMLEIGDKLQTRYVLAGRAQWRSRNVWIGMSNRIKSICTVDVMILDMNSRRLVLDARGIEGDSTENKNLYNTITNVIGLNPLPLVMPGSIAPYEQRAVSIAIARAMHPWIKTERLHMALSQADESSEAESESNPTPKFSTLVSPVHDLQASLHVTTKDAKQLEAMDKDIARLYALHETGLQYKEAGRLRLSANSPKDGQEALIFNPERRVFAIGGGKTVSEQDLSDAPTRRAFLFEYCGLLTTDMFDTMRARFVKQEKLESVPAVVYDLTYWGLDEGPYYRVWIDPERRLILRCEDFDRDSKLKTIMRYKQPTEIAPDIWLPGSVEIEDANKKEFTTIKITNARANKGIPDSVFITQKH